jgi:hypothetical protein
MESDCPAFGKLWSETVPECIACAKAYPDEYAECSRIYKESHPLVIKRKRKYRIKPPCREGTKKWFIHKCILEAKYSRQELVEAVCAFTSEPEHKVRKYIRSCLSIFNSRQAHPSLRWKRNRQRKLYFKQPDFGDEK